MLLSTALFFSLLGRVGGMQLGTRGNSTFEAALALGSVWEFPLPAEWVGAPPLDYSYGRCNYAAVTATNVGTGTVETGFIRYGIENHGSCADSHCGGDWGRFCMVKGGTSGTSSTTGVDDFPYFNTWVHHSTPNCRTTSDSGWGGGCSGAVLTFWAQGSSGWETVYAWSGPVSGTTQTWTRTMTAGETVRVGFDAAGSNAPAPPPPTPAPTPSPTPSPTLAPTSHPTSSPTSAPALLCQYAPRAVQMNTESVPGDFQGTDDSCISGGGFSPTPTWFGHLTADEFHAGLGKVGCLEFTLDIDAYIVTHYGRHAAWSQTCPITIFVDATRTNDETVTGTIIDEIGSATPGYYSQVFTSSTYAAGTQFMMCEGRDQSTCGITVDYIKIYGGAAPTPAPTPASTPSPTASPSYVLNTCGQLCSDNGYVSITDSTECQNSVQALNAASGTSYYWAGDTTYAYHDMPYGCYLEQGGIRNAISVSNAVNSGIYHGRCTVCKASAPSSTPSPPTPAGPAGGGAASAKGDPHLQNVHGQRFDLMKPGKHLLINIPKGETADAAMLRVEADARRLGGCSDMYFQELNVTGSWAEQQQAGGFRYSVSQSAVVHPEWVAFYTVELKVVRGFTVRGFGYLNLYVKHLGRAGFAVGGLLGDDDHSDAATVPTSCRKHAVALVDQEEHKGDTPSMMSSAEATYL